MRVLILGDDDELLTEAFKAYCEGDIEFLNEQDAKFMAEVTCNLTTIDEYQYFEYKPKQKHPPRTFTNTKKGKRRKW